MTTNERVHATAVSVMDAPFSSDRETLAEYSERVTRESNPNVGTIYLLHFERPYGHARHYLGWTSDLDQRLADHAAGSGANLTRVIRRAGIGFKLARTWTGTRRYERRLKVQGGHARKCPICKAHE